LRTLASRHIPPRNDAVDKRLAKLLEAFGASGTITSSTMMEDAKGRKFAFVNYETTEAAQKAVEAMNKKDVRSEAQKEKDKLSKKLKWKLNLLSQKAEKKEEL